MRPPLRTNATQQPHAVDVTGVRAQATKVLAVKDQ